MADISRATSTANGVAETIDDMFVYHPWNEDQQKCGAGVREVLAQAVKTIIELVPPGPDRSVAVRKLREARMDCNSAITHGGKY